MGICGITVTEFGLEFVDYGYVGQLLLQVGFLRQEFVGQLLTKWELNWLTTILRMCHGLGSYVPTSHHGMIPG